MTDPKQDPQPEEGAGSNEPTVSFTASPAPQAAAGKPEPEADEPGEAEQPADGAAADAVVPGEGEGGATAAKSRRRTGGTSVVIGLLLALLGFTLVVQVQSNSTDKEFSSARQDDLVRLLSDLDALQDRLLQDVTTLERTRGELASGAAGREAALADAAERADDLGILAGTLPAQGPGIEVRFADASDPITASHLLNAVQELRGAGAEAMQIDSGGRSVRIIASTYFVDADGGVTVDGQKLTSPYTIKAIGDPSTMRTAMRIVGGVVARVAGDGGNVSVTEYSGVLVNARASAPSLEYAKPVS